MFSSLVSNLAEAGSIRINQQVYDLKRKGIDVTVLSLGEAFFDIPVFDFNELDFAKGNHYSDTQGLPELRRSIAHYYQTQHHVSVDADQNVLVSVGSKILIYMCLLSLVNPGDEVIIHEPYWLSYPEQIKLCRGNVVIAPYWTRGEDFKQYVTSRTKLVILNNPNNPSGRVYEFEELRQIYQICLESGATLLVDEAYADFCINDEFRSAGLLDSELKNIIVVNSISKSMGMSGWRIGYMLAHPKVIYEVLRLNQQLVTCCPSILALYCSKFFKDILEHSLPQARKVVEKRQRLASFMDSIGLTYMIGTSTFYFFVDIRDSGLTSHDFAEQLLAKHGIAVVPGSCYGVHTDGFVRIGVGSESEERIKSALTVLRSFFKGASLSPGLQASVV